MSFLSNGGGYPRNTSNGDYGKFHFLGDNPNNANHGGTQGQFSTDGNRMTQHVHYPNCPNHRQSGGKGAAQQGGNRNQNQGQAQGQAQGNGNANGMPEYTIEYGEDAVRAALGGNMPDFQAQFQKQYGSMNGGNMSMGGGDAGAFQISPEQMQMLNGAGGKSKVAMIPVVLTTDDQEQGAGAAEAQQGQGSPTGEENSQVAGPAEGKLENQKRPKPVNALNAMDAVRRSRSTGPVKCGRHIRPSYWNPQAPNPCRKKSSFGNESANGDSAPEANQPSPQEVATSYAQYYSQYDGTPNGYANQNQGQMFPEQGSQGQMFPQQGSQGQMFPEQEGQVQMAPQLTSRARSLPPKKAAASLCGKCQKCKNLTSTVDAGQTKILTFPKYSTGPNGSHQKLNTSSNLGQSAKNFRAIRFSSNQNRNFNLSNM